MSPVGRKNLILLSNTGAETDTVPLSDTTEYEYAAPDLSRINPGEIDYDGDRVPDTTVE